jgi:hypothetical protein
MSPKLSLSLRFQIKIFYDFRFFFIIVAWTTHFTFPYLITVIIFGEDTNYNAPIAGENYIRSSL